MRWLAIIVNISLVFSNCIEVLCPEIIDLSCLCSMAPHGASRWESVSSNCSVSEKTWLERTDFSENPFCKACLMHCWRCTPSPLSAFMMQVAPEEPNARVRTGLGHGVPAVGGGIFKSAAVEVLRRERRLMTTGEITKCVCLAGTMRKSRAAGALRLLLATQILHGAAVTEWRIERCVCWRACILHGLHWMTHRVALERGFLKAQGKTPEATMASAMYTDVKKKGSDSLFTR